MFTGIVQDVGTIVDIVKDGDWTIKIKTDKLSLLRTPVGASMACAGICLTLIAKTYNTFQVQASPETLSKTTVMKWKPGMRVNLEPALHVGDELGGHFVTGHVDGVAFVTAKTRDSNCVRMTFGAPAELARFLAPKGSATIDGVSLTVNEIDHAFFNVTLIPHTLEATTLGALSVDDAVNFEADMIARYAERLLHPQQ